MRSQGVRLEGPKLFNIQRHRSLPKILPSSAPQAIRARAGCERYLSESPSGAVSYARTRFQGDLAPSGNNGEKGVASVPRGTVLKSCSTADRFAYVHLDPCQSPFFFWFSIFGSRESGMYRRTLGRACGVNEKSFWTFAVAARRYNHGSLINIQWRGRT